jgi:hypothetical protein
MQRRRRLRRNRNLERQILVEHAAAEGASDGRVVWRKHVIIALLARCVAHSVAAQNDRPRNAGGKSAAAQKLILLGKTSSAIRLANSVSEIAETYFRTTHRLTSQLPRKDSIAGSFAPNANVLKTGNPDL